MLATWRGLQALKLVHEPIDSSDYKYWAHSLAEFSGEDLLRGLKLAEDWTGFLLLGNFKELCRKPIAVPGRRAPIAIESLPASKEVVARYRAERKARTGI